MADVKQTRGIGIYINGEEVANQFKGITAAAARLKNEIAQLEIGSEAYNKKAAEIRVVNDLIKEHHANLRPIQSTWDKMKSGLLGFAAVAGVAFGASEIIQYGQQLYKAGIQLDALQRKAEIVFGEELPKATAAAKEHAASMGLTTSQYVAAAAATQDLLIPMGYAREEATEMSLEIVNLSGALSEWTGGQKTSKEVSGILTKALLGEREEMKQLGIAISENDVKNKLAAEGHDKLTGKALEQAKAHATLTLILEKSTDAQTAFSTGSGSAIRTQAELTAKIGEIGEKLARLLLPALASVVNFVGDVVDGFGSLVDGLDEMSGSSSRASQGLIKLQTQFNIEIETLKNANLSQDARKRLIEEINKKYAVYLPNLLTEQSNIEEITRVQDLANASFLKKITLLAAEEKFKDVQKRLLDAKMQELDLQKQLTDERTKSSMATPGYGGSNPGAYGLDVAKTLVDKNLQTQKDLQAEFENTKKAAFDLGLTLDDLNGEKPKGGNGGGTGTGGEDDTKSAEKRRDRLLDLEKDLQQKLKEIRAAAALDALQDEEARAVLAIEQKYAKELEAATTGEFKNVAQVKALVGQLEIEKGNEIARIQTEFRAKEADARLKFFEDESAKRKVEAQTELEERAKEADERLKFFADQKSAQQLIAEFTATDARANELAELEAHYLELLAKASKYGGDVEAITKAFEAKKAGIIAESNAATVKNEQETQQKRLAALQASSQALGSLVTATADLLGEKGEEHGAFVKALTLFQIAVDTASAISSLVAISNANPGNILTFGAAGTAQFIAGMAQIVSNMARARNLLTAPVPQKFEGGYHDVVGEKDGKTYNAKSIGRPETGMLPNYPSIVLASEEGAEYFVAAEDLKNPVVANYVRMIDNISHNRTPVPQFAEGGATQPVAFVPSAVTGLDSINTALLKVLEKLDARLDEPFYAILPDQTLLLAFRRFDDINAATGGFYSPT
jgi:hypothetical protein